MVERKTILRTKINVFLCVNIVLLLCGNQTAQKRSNAIQTINQLEQHVKVKSKKPSKKNDFINRKAKFYHVYDTKMVMHQSILFLNDFPAIKVKLVLKVLMNQQ